MPGANPSAELSSRRRIGLVICLQLGLLIGAKLTGIVDAFDRESLQAMATRSGTAGMLAFAVTFAVGELLRKEARPRPRGFKVHPEPALLVSLVVTPAIAWHLQNVLCPTPAIDPGAHRAAHPCALPPLALARPQTSPASSSLRRRLCRGARLSAASWPISPVSSQQRWALR